MASRHLFLNPQILCIFAWLMASVLFATPGSTQPAPGNGAVMLTHGVGANLFHPNRAARVLSGNRTRVIPKIMQCLLRPTSTLNESAINAASKNYYECPGTLTQDYIECCDNNRCCLLGTNRSRFFPWPSNSTEVTLSIFALFAVIFAIVYLCCCCPPCPFFLCWTDPKPYESDYAGCAHKMSESEIYETMLANGGDITEESLAEIEASHMREFSLAAPPLPPSGRSCRVSIAEACVHADGEVIHVASGSGTTDGRSSSLGNPVTNTGCGGVAAINLVGTRYITMHSSSATRVNSMDATMMHHLMMPRSSTSVTFSKPPMKSILKMNHCPRENEPRKFGYRHPSSSSASSESGSSHRSNRSTSHLVREEPV